jgi:hypothetical protein
MLGKYATVKIPLPLADKIVENSSSKTWNL